MNRPFVILRSFARPLPGLTATGLCLVLVLAVPGRATAQEAGTAAARKESIRGLARAATPESAKALAAALGDREPAVRRAAALALASVAEAFNAADKDPGDLDDALAAAVTPLLPLLADADVGVVQAAATALGTIGPDDDDNVTDDIVDALGRAAVRVKDAAACAACVTALADMGPAAASATPALARLLRHDQTTVREAAATALAAIGPDARAAVAELVRTLADRDRLVAAASASALAAIGPDARAAVGPLAAALSAPDAMLRGTAARALGDIGPDAADAAGSLAAAVVREQDADVLRACIDACGEIGPGAVEAVPALVGQLAATAAETRESAASALAAIGPAAAATAAGPLERLLADKEPAVRLAAADGLVGVGRTGPAVRRAIAEALASGDAGLRAAAAEVAGDLGPAAAPFLPRLAALATDDKDVDVRVAAVTALAEVGEAGAAALGRALADPDADVRHAAAYALADNPEAAATLVPGLIKALSDESVPVQLEAAHALGGLGKAAAAARPVLEKLAAADDDVVADVARQALAAITGVAAGAP